MWINKIKDEKKKLLKRGWNQRSQEKVTKKNEIKERKCFMRSRITNAIFKVLNQIKKTLSKISLTHLHNNCLL